MARGKFGFIETGVCSHDNILNLALQMDNGPKARPQATSLRIGEIVLLPLRLTADKVFGAIAAIVS
jgi:hypothetical protein